MNSDSKILFVHPALAATVPFPRLTPVVEGQWLIFRGVRLHLNVAEHRCSFEHEERTDSYLFEVSPGTWAVAYAGWKENWATLSAKLTPDQLEKWSAEQATIASDTEGYTLRRTAEVAAKRETRIREDEARKTARAKAQQEAEERQYNEALDAFRAGEGIDFAEFELLCKKFGITIPIQTLGSGRKNISAIGYQSMTIRKGSNPAMALTLAQQLKRAITPE